MDCEEEGSFSFTVQMNRRTSVNARIFFLSVTLIDVLSTHVLSGGWRVNARTPRQTTHHKIYRRKFRELACILPRPLKSAQLPVTNQRSLAPEHAHSLLAKVFMNAPRQTGAIKSNSHPTSVDRRHGEPFHAMPRTRKIGGGDGKGK